MITLKRIRSQFTPWPEDLPNDPKFHRQLNGIALGLQGAPAVQPHKARVRKAQKIIKQAEKLRRELANFYGDHWEVLDGRWQPWMVFSDDDDIFTFYESTEAPSSPRERLADLLRHGVPAKHLVDPRTTYPIPDDDTRLDLNQTHHPDLCEAELLKLMMAMQAFTAGTGKPGPMPAIRERMACDKVADLFQIYQIPVTFHVESLFVATCACVLERGEKPGETATEREAIAGRAATQATTHCRRIVSERRAKQAP